MTPNAVPRGPNPPIVPARPTTPAPSPADYRRPTDRDLGPKLPPAPPLPIVPEDMEGMYFLG